MTLMKNRIIWFSKLLGKLVLFLAGFIAIYLGIAFLLSSIKVDREADDGRDVQIYILSNGVHTDIVVPAKNEQFDWTSLVKYQHTLGKDSSANWLAMGWGDKGFYLQTPPGQN